MPEIVKVAMADLKVSRDPAVLITIGLGSCIGIALYDPVVKVGGLAHIMLPTSRRAGGNDNSNPMKYADTGIEMTLAKMIELDAVKRRITAKIAGGAHMFASMKEGATFLKIGDNNAAAVKEKLSQEKIKLLAEDTGFDYGRTVELHTKDGSYVIKTIAKGSKVI